MSEAIKWIPLALCLLIAASRFRAVTRGESRSIFAVFMLTSGVIALNISDIYLAVDRVLGERNYAYLLLRLMLLGVFALLGIRTAAGYQHRSTARLVAAPAGYAVLGVSAVVLAAAFLLSDLPVSSPGLSLYRDAPGVLWLTKAGLLYPAFVAVCLLRPTTEAVLRARRVPVRASSALLLLGFVLVLVITALPIEGRRVEDAATILSYTATLSIAAGITVLWAARRREQRMPPPSLREPD